MSVIFWFTLGHSTLSDKNTRSETGEMRLSDLVWSLAVTSVKPKPFRALLCLLGNSIRSFPLACLSPVNADMYWKLMNLSIDRCTPGGPFYENVSPSKSKFDYIPI